MSKVTVEVCSCCAMTEKYIADSVDRIRAQHGDQVEIVPRKCLDICAEHGAVKIGDEVLVLKESDIAAFEEKVRNAAK